MTDITARASAIQLRSLFLRENTPGVAADSAGGMVAMPETAAPDPGKKAKPRRGHWRERDLQRAIEVAKRSGVTAYRVELAPDGTIAIVVGQQDRRSGRTSVRMRRPLIH